MASQLAIEITLEQAQACIYIQNAGSNTAAFTPTYWLTEVNLIPEVLEFDGSYGKCFYLRTNLKPKGGVFHACREFSEAETLSKFSIQLS